MKLNKALLKELWSNARYNWVDIVVFLSVYIICSIILLVCFIVGPVNYVNERESWETSDCICISSDSYEENDYNYSTASFIVYFVNGSSSINTNTTGITPPIVGPPDIEIGQLYSCAIDPLSIYDSTLSVFPTIWLDHWNTQITVYIIITTLLIVISLIPVYICMVSYIRTYCVPNKDEIVKINVDSHEFVRMHEEKWKTSLANFFDTVPLNPVTMFNGVVHSGSPFRSNFTTAISSNNECSSPNVENLSIVRNAIRDDNLFDAVKEFYNSHELSLRGCLMDWMENTGILNQVNQHASTNSQATPNNRNYDTWSLNSTDTTKQPLDKILGVKESLQPEANNPPLCHVCAPCFVFSYIIVLFMGVLGYGLVIFVCVTYRI